VRADTRFSTIRFVEYRLIKGSLRRFLRWGGFLTITAGYGKLGLYESYIDQGREGYGACAR